MTAGLKGTTRVTKSSTLIPQPLLHNLIPKFSQITLNELGFLLPHPMAGMMLNLTTLTVMEIIFQLPT